MSNLRIGRHLKESLKNILRNIFMTSITLLSVAITLLIVGVFLIVILNINSITKDIEKNVEVIVYVDLDVDNDGLKKLESEIKSNEKVSEVKFIHKDEGLLNLLEDLGENGKAFETLKEDNPLNDTFVVKTVDPLDTEYISEEIQKLNNVEKVDYGGEIVTTLFTVTAYIRNLGIVLISGLVLTAMLLIANTIKMNIEMRSEEIKIMRLVGATNMFIKIPFIIEGALLGILGAFIPIVITNVGYAYFIKIYETSMKLSFVKLISFWEMFIYANSLLIFLSVLIGVLGSMVSVQKYLKV